MVLGLFVLKSACVTGIRCVLVPAVSALKVGVSEAKGTCMKLRQKLGALEKETAAKIAEMDQCNNVLQVKIKQYQCNRMAF